MKTVFSHYLCSIEMLLLVSRLLIVFSEILKEVEAN